MSTVLDTIALRLPPADGEALDSYLERYARLLHARVRDIFALAGLETRWGALIRHRPRWPLSLDGAQADALAAVTGIPATGITAMTLARYNGTGLAQVDPGTRLLGAARWWRIEHGSRFCPACLADGGRWMLAWRLPWAFACTIHRVLLADVCRACGKRHRHRLPPEGGAAGLCETTGLPRPPQRPGQGSPRCTFPLHQAPVLALPTHGMVLRAQQHIVALTADLVGRHDRCVDTADPSRQLDDLYLVARTALSALRGPFPPPPVVTGILAELRITVDRPGQLRGHGAHTDALTRPASGQHRRDAAVIAAGTAIAAAMLAERREDPDPHVSAWLADTAVAYARQSTPAGVLAAFATASPPIRTALLRRLSTRLGTVDKLRYSAYTNTPHPPRPGAGTARAAHVPATLWPGWALRLMPPDGFNPVPYRKALSILLLVAGSKDTTIEKAQALLGYPHTDAASANISAFLSRLGAHGLLEPVLGAIGQLARALDQHGAPIDYSRRRRTRALSQARLDLTAWRRHRTALRHPDTPTWVRHVRALSLGDMPARRQQEAFARLRLIELLTGLHPHAQPAPLHLTRRDRGEYNHFLFRLPRQSADLLESWASALLRRAGIDEPVGWEPPFDWVTAIAWPGPHPEAIALDRLRELRDARVPPRQIAALLGTCPQHIYLAGARHPDPRAHPPAGTARRPPPAGPEPLTPHLLRELLGKGLRPHQIARTTGYSRHEIRTLLNQAGLRAPRHTPPAPPDPLWLREQYHVNRYSLKDLALRTGHSVEQLAACARTAGIPLRPGVAGRTHTLAEHGGPHAFPPAIWASLATPADVKRVRRFLAVLQQPTLSRAASALGVNGAANLDKQIRYLEAQVGFELLDRTPAPAELRPTAAGHQYAIEAQHALALLGTAPG